MSQRIDTILDVLREVKAAIGSDASLEDVQTYRISATTRLADE
jgi:hypothetical protein